MVLQSANSISFNDISNEFLGISNITTYISNFYANSSSNYTTGISGLPLIGNPIYLSNFYSKSCILGSITFTTIGNTSWTIPNGVNMISAVCIGGGGSAVVTVATTGSKSIGGGGGGALAYINKISVIPGSIFTITVGAGGVNGTAGGDSFIAENGGNIIVRAGGGKQGQYTSTSGSNSAAGGAGGTVLVGNGGNGGNGANIVNGFTGYANYGGGGGAGGYSGNGGNGGNRSGGGKTDGSGGGGGGGWGAQAIYTTPTVGAATLGGGTAIFGEGSNGLASTAAGLNGSSGSTNINVGLSAYGYGSGGKASGTSAAGAGAVRIVYGTQAYFPFSNVS